MRVGSVGGEGGKKVDRHAVGVLELRVPLPPEGVPRLLLTLEAGPRRACVCLVDPGRARALEGERELMREHGTDVLITKDSGGTYTRPKMDAAAELGVKVVVVRQPGGPGEVQTVNAVAEAIDWVKGLR